MTLIYLKRNFVSQVIEAWSEVWSSYKIPYENFGNQIIWNNSHIKVNGKVLFMEICLIKVSIVRVRDLLDNNNNPLDFLSFIQIYSPFNFSSLNYWGLIKAIHKRWKLTLLIVHTPLLFFHFVYPILLLL